MEKELRALTLQVMKVLDELVKAEEISEAEYLHHCEKKRQFVNSPFKTLQAS